jgi:circadian clock protein KaiC
MSEPQRVVIQKVPTGVPGLDEVLGGGLPEYSLTLIAGGPGAGKTTLADQIMFANASAEHPALCVTVLGEPPLKLLRYQQQMRFFDLAKVDTAVHFVNLSHEVKDGDLSTLLQSLITQVEQIRPGIVVVDSFRTVTRGRRGMTVQSFVQRLGLYLTGLQATTFLVSEYRRREFHDNPVLTVTDGILWLSQSVTRNSVVRKLQVVKLRGQAPMPGLHTFRISDEGVQVFPRILQRAQRERPQPAERLSTGAAGLDEMLGGGLPAGDSVLVAGPAGSGKSVLAGQFIAEGVRRGEPGVIAVFEEYPQEYLRRAKGLGFDLEAMVRDGKLAIIYLRPLDLSVDETLLEIRSAVARLHAKRLVIDSLSGFELALAPAFREDFRESVYRMLGALTGSGITALMTVEITASFTDLRFSPEPHAISFLADDLILQRYIELEGQLMRALTVVKMRGSQHSKDLRAYEITSEGLVVGERLRDYRGLLGGAPTPR